MASIRQRLIRLMVGLSLAVTTGGVTAAAVTAMSDPTAAHASSTVGGSILRSEVLARAQYWVDQNVVYGTVFDGNDHVVSTRSAPDRDGKAYRTDCSGLVSMAWHLSNSPTTSDFQDWPSSTHLANADDLKPGDAVLFPGHIELFAGWKNDSDHNRGAWSYSLNGPADHDWAKGPVPNSHGQVGTIEYGDIQKNIRLRYPNIVDDPQVDNSPVYNATAVVDVSGDGIADLLATTPDGKLWYYPNNFGTNPDGTPFTTKKLVGSGWQGFNHVTAGDLNQDGHADILATKPDGTLWYYQNSQNSDDPYTTGTQIGYGFQQYNRILAADVSGDGAADLIAVKPDGTLWFYPNNSTTNPNHTPFTTANQIGYGFQEYNRLTTADINGDGFDDLIASNVDGTLTEYENTQAFSSPYDQPSQIGYGFQEYSSITAGDITADGHADLITIKPDGTLWEYPNNSGTNPGHIPYTSPNQIGYGWTGFANIF